MTTFREVKQYLNCIPNISQGGCGIAALAMKRWLKENKKINANIVYGFTRNLKTEYKKNHAVINNKINKNNATSCTHAGIRLPKRKFIVDVNSRWSEKNYEYLLEMPEEVVVYSLNNNLNTWNYMFDRNYIYDIEKDLKIDLSDISII